MKRLLSFIALVSILFFASITHAQRLETIEPGFVLADVVLYRPLGFIATLVGSAVFVGISPLTALASIPAPHDAFDKTYKILVQAPAAYTFIRPVGERRFIGYLPLQRKLSRPTPPPTSNANHRKPTIAPKQYPLPVLP